jgi:SAM-dependent methyltransferase
MSASTHAERLAPVESGHFWFAGRDHLVRRLLDHHAAPEPVLDLGCGTGRFASSLAADGRRVIAIDPAPDLTLAPVGATLVGSAEQVPLADGSVGTVMVRDVLEHLDDAVALSECHRVLRAGGLLVVLVPAWPSLWSVRDVRAGHLRRYTRPTLRAAVTAAGFDVVALRGYQLTLLPVVAALRWYAARRPGPAPIASLHHEEHPPGLLNTALGWVNRAEAAMVTWPVPVPPTGTSLVLVARRP